MNFKPFRNAVNKQIQKLLDSNNVLLVTDVVKDELYDTYLASFPVGTNPMFRERTEHDCNCCQGFIRKLGNVVAEVNGNLESIWDIDPEGVDEGYVVVANALSAFVKAYPIVNVLRLQEAQVGVEHNHDGETGQMYNHFYQEMPSAYVVDRPNHPLNLVLNHKTALTNSLAIDIGSIELVLELALSQSLYRGEEKVTMLEQWIKLSNEYNQVSDDVKTPWLFTHAVQMGEFANLRGSAIGTLVEAVSKGEDLNTAVAKYEKMVAPEDYKRSSAPVTQGMIKQAMEKVTELGIEDALPRRFANIDDITINNVLFADNSVKTSMGVFDAIQPTKLNVPNLDKIEEVSIDNFLNNVLPTATAIEVMVSNDQKNNFVSLVAPVNPDASNILNWGNNFSWSYNGDVTDSMMKERVKNAGGNVDGDIRFSIQWNEDRNDSSVDLDAHAKTPDTIIYFGNDRDNQGGKLDVDIRHPGNRTAVENITWPDLHKMKDGKYEFKINVYSGSCKDGFRAEVSILGTVYEYAYNQPMRKDAVVTVATLTVKDGQATIKHHLDSSSSSLDVWGVPTNQFVKVRTVLNSPNHWDGEETGLKHVFFMLEDCINPDSVRGLYNEFLTNSLHPHRKVFELLGSKLRAPHTDNQLSGVGFATGKRNSLVCKVSGSYSRTIKIIF